MTDTHFTRFVTAVLITGIVMFWAIVVPVFVYEVIVNSHQTQDTNGCVQNMADGTCAP